MSSPNFWDAGFVPPAIDKDLLGSLTKAVTQAVAQGEQVAGQVVGEVIPSVINSTTGTVTTSGSILPTPTGGNMSTISIEQAAIRAAEEATKAVLPGLQQALQQTLVVKAQAELTAILQKVQGGAIAAVPTPEDFTKADSRSRAFRTLLTGLAMSAIWGVVNVLTVVAGVDWHNPGAKSQVAVMVMTSVVGSVAAYVERALKEPNHVTASTIITPPTPLVS